MKLWLTCTKANKINGHAATSKLLEIVQGFHCILYSNSYVDCWCQTVIVCKVFMVFDPVDSQLIWKFFIIFLSMTFIYWFICSFWCSYSVFEHFFRLKTLVCRWSSFINTLLWDKKHQWWWSRSTTTWMRRSTSEPQPHGQVIQCITACEEIIGLS